MQTPTDAPQIIQRRRRPKGYKHPEGTLFVTRPLPMSNPYKVTEKQGFYFVAAADGSGVISSSDKNFALRCAVYGYEYHMSEIERTQPDKYAAMMRRVLAAPFVACSCVPGSVCHAPVLIQLAVAWRAGGGE